jgi:myo-inositol-1(or 4)-monophosphatase
MLLRSGYSGMLGVGMWQISTLSCLFIRSFSSHIQDVCAGIAILLQTGGIVVDSNPVQGLGEDEAIPMANLGGRRYAVS